MAAPDEPSQQQREGPLLRRGTRQASLGQGGEFVEAWMQRRPAWPLAMNAKQLRLGATVPSRRRFWPASRNRVDWRQSARRWARWGRIGLEPVFRKTQRHPGRVVILWDVSGSMAGYVPLYLPWIHRLMELLPRLGVFPFGTTVGDVSHALRAPYPVAARTLKRVEDLWAGGTAIGQSFARWIQDFGDHWLGADTTVLIISDGWDVGDPAMLRASLAELRRRSRRIVWLNPLAATPGFEARTRGLKTAQPFVARWVAADSWPALWRLGQSLA